LDRGDLDIFLTDSLLGEVAHSLEGIRKTDQVLLLLDLCENGLASLDLVELHREILRLGNPLPWGFLDLMQLGEFLLDFMHFSIGQARWLLGESGRSRREGGTDLYGFSLH
jgi:hypothetical protein